jgi:hypothetical protein
LRGSAERACPRGDFRVGAHEYAMFAFDWRAASPATAPRAAMRRVRGVAPPSIAALSSTSLIRRGTPATSGWS